MASILTALALPAWTLPAAADPPDPREASDRLFYEGNERMAQGDVPEACRKFEQSLMLLRRGGALLNLALCREAAGELASALPLFQESLELAARDGRADREEVARQHLEAIRSKIPPAPAARAAPARETREAAPSPPTPAPKAPAARVASTAEAAVKRAPAPPSDRALAHGFQIGAVARVDVDPLHAGARVAAGLTFGVGDLLDVGASALLGRDLGIEPQLTFFLRDRAAFKPLLNLGLPIFFTRGAELGVRGAAGVQWDVSRHFGVFAQVGVAYFPSAAPSYAHAVFLPSLGAQGRL